VNAGGLDGASPQVELLSGSLPASGASDISGLIQMGTEAGLSGDALQAFIDSGGTAGSTAAGGGGIATLISGGDLVTPEIPASGRETVPQATTPSVPAPLPAQDEFLNPLQQNGQVQPFSGTPNLDVPYVPAAGGGLVSGLLDAIKENKTLATIGGGLISSLIQGTSAPAVAKAKAQAEAEAAQQLEDNRRRNTSISGVRFGVKPTGKMLRSPGLIGRGV
jgi:hypothetical protein